MEYTQELEEIDKIRVNKTDKYFCIIRKSFVPATPEEKVRQNFLKYLIEKKKFPINRIFVEKSLSHYGKGKRRVDILIEDSNELPFFIYECKKEGEPYTDEVINQTLDYFELLDTVEYAGIIIGNQLDLTKAQNIEPYFVAVEQPNIDMVNSGQFVILPEAETKYVRNNWKKPLDKKIVEELINYWVIGEGTDDKFHSFLINLDGWLLDQKDKLNLDPNIEDIGIKNTKFGSAGGGFFAKEYRSFLIKNQKDKPIICIALTSMVSGKNSPIRTTIYVGVETTKEKNSSLQIQVGKSVQLIDDKVLITHNGTITVGKYGAAKKQDLLDFVEERKPSLIKNGLVYLGEFNENEEINSQNVGSFIKNLIDYALLRNEFREIRKQAVANKGYM